MDIFKSKKPIYHIAQQLQLPGVALRNNTKVPSILVLNIMVPTAAPSMFGKNKPGETVNVVFCFVMKPSTAHALEHLDEASPSIRLLNKHFLEAPSGGALANGIKLIGNICNWEEAKLPSMLKSFNGKPTLVTKSGHTAVSP